MAKKYQYALEKPSKKIKVLLIGNKHSGKTDFLNWYTNDNRTSINYSNEGKNFNIITNGKKYSELDHAASHQLFPFLQKHLIGTKANTLISPSSSNQFKNIIFIDTPDINSASSEELKPILSLADDCDLICFFIEPIGKAYDDKLKFVANELFKSCPTKLKFYLVTEIQMNEMESIVK
jgi:GTPase SAR1 family protein